MSQLDLIELLKTYQAENNANLQFLKEVETEDAVYSVYLKKITYNASRNVYSDEVGVATVNFKTKEVKILKAGNLDRLIDALFLDSGEIDGTVVRIFLATYRTFCTAHLLAERLTKLYESYEMSDNQRSKIIQRSIVSVLSIWLDLYPQDFSEAPSYQCLLTIRSFLKRAAPTSDLYARVCQRFTKLCAEDEPDDGVSVESSDSSDSANARRPFSSVSDLVEVVDFSQLNVRTIAEQLTRLDAELFIKLDVHQCLGSIWNQRSKQKANECPTVAATVEMFNAVIYRVISTILKDLDLKPTKRAKLIEKWIYIAQELRIMKNFSSLHAIISGLQSSPIFRLQKLWQHVNKEVLDIYKDLAAIFSLDSNQITSRELLMKEGTAKNSNQGTTRKRSRDKSASRQPYFTQYDQGALCCGTVPYLGTFLSDLTMIDSAFPDFTDSGLINFEKRRKEFEIIAQIHLFQSAAKMYHFEPHRRFTVWFNSMRVYTENESYTLSCELEPLNTPEKSKSTLTLSKSSSLTKSKSFSSLTLSFSSLMSISPASPDKFSLDSADSAHPITSQSSISSNDSDAILPDRRVIKVCVLRPDCNDIMYKSMLLSNKDRAPTVIRRVFDKFHMEGVAHSDYCLVQIADKNKELLFPADANVFYAMDASCAESTFFVRHKDFKGSLKKTASKKSLS